jgi:hypothetical protein
MNSTQSGPPEEITDSSPFGLVLSSIPLGESDLVLEVLFVGFGKKRVHARGIRKSKQRMSGSLEIFEYASFSLSKSKRGNRIQLEGISNRKPFMELRKNLFSYEAGSLLIEIASRLIPEDDPEAALLLPELLRILTKLGKLTKQDSDSLDVSSDYLMGYALLVYGILQICKNAGLDPSDSEGFFRDDDQRWFVQMLSSDTPCIYSPQEAAHRACTSLKKFVEYQIEGSLRSRPPKPKGINKK